MKKLILFLLLSVLAFGQMSFSDPEPDFENPRKWVIRVNSSDIVTMNHTLNAINNVLKEYPQESLKIAVIFYASGVRVIKNDFDSKTLTRLKSLMPYEMEFIACVNTMQTMGWKKSDMIEGLDYVQAGIVEAIERVAGGWIDVTPY